MSSLTRFTTIILASPLSFCTCVESIREIMLLPWLKLLEHLITLRIQPKPLKAFPAMELGLPLVLALWLSGTPHRLFPQLPDSAHRPCLLAFDCQLKYSFQKTFWSPSAVKPSHSLCLPFDLLSTFHLVLPNVTSGVCLLISLECRLYTLKTSFHSHYWNHWLVELSQVFICS